MNKLWACLAAATLLTAACGDDDGTTEADALGVGAQCGSDDDCHDDGDADAGDAIEQSCLTQFTGGYCGVEDCTGNDDCPEGSACVAHDDGSNYCFRICLDKSECNANRDPANAANCSANIDFVDADTQGKACVPPSSGT